MKTIQIHASPKQLSRLRNGHSVTLKRPVEGEGISIVVDPGRYNIMSRTFDSGRGSRVRLSPEEISANVSMEGSGLRTKSKQMAKAIFQEPEERSEKQVTNAGGPMARLTPRTMKAVSEQSQLFSHMNSQLGTNFGAQQSSTMGNLGANLKQAGSDIETVENRTSDQVFGTGLYTSRREGGSVGRNGGFVHGQPPALQSQPYGANFQFSKTLPVAYQRFSGNGLGP
jgi:hypothetical protein